MGALNIGRSLLIAWAAIASLGVAYMGYRSGWLVGELRTSRADLMEAQTANDQWVVQAGRLQTALDQCEAEFETVQRTAERDANVFDAQIAGLEKRLQETRNEISDALQREATPELAACLRLPVPAGVLERMRAAADRAARAGRDRAPGLDPAAGAPGGAAYCAAAPDHAGCVSG